MTYDQAIRADERERWATYCEGLADRHGANDTPATTLRALASDMRADLAPDSDAALNSLAQEPIV